jgi:hypothetical protein
MKEKVWIRRTSKKGEARVTIPQKMFDAAALNADTEYTCSLDTNEMVLYYHPSKQIGSMPLGSYKIYAGGKTQSPSMGVPRPYADMFYGYSPAAWISIDADTKLITIEMIYKYGKR